jgi:type I restriction enzyme S subunit
MESSNNWTCKSLNDIVNSVTIGLVKNSREQDPGFDYTYIKMNNIGNDNSFNLFKSAAVNASKEEILKYCLQDNDVLFNTRNSVELVGKSCLYRSWSNAPVLYNNNIARIRFKDEISPAYAAYAFCSPFLKDQLESMKQGTTNVAAIYYKSLKNLKIGYPSITEQQEIVEKLNQLSKRTEKLTASYKSKLNSLDELKKSLLQKAFSGDLTKGEGRAA